MLDFAVDYCFAIKVFTNVEWVKEKYKNSCFEFVGDCKDSDICILDSNYKVNEESKFIINIEKFNDGVDAFISQCYIEAYLNLIEKFDPDVCGIGMADFSDIRAVTKGSLIEYLKLNIVSDDEMKYISDFKNKIKGASFEGSTILFISQTDLLKLHNYSKVIEELYRNMDIVILMPSIKNIEIGKYVELFVFKKEGEFEYE